MNECTEPHHAVVGQLIAHDLVPNWVMEVWDVKECTQDGARPQSHLSYRIVDPMGAMDWLCAYDVHPVSVREWVASSPDLVASVVFAAETADEPAAIALSDEGR